MKKSDKKRMKLSNRISASRFHLITAIYIKKSKSGEGNTEYIRTSQDLWLASLKDGSTA